ncbi:MAG: hypothetical protein L0332_34230 [Chloroflexi bacterium]|nr:hypothetical protein [Chloroflexota bacterium]MCI0644134.1 hypothetical protein [Chloroflexota bacterium]MCI0731755.1 hypothetical protein [Chloroflexota bacterium]
MLFVLQDKPIDVEALAATMAQLDIHYLRTPTSAEPLPLEPSYLIAVLAQYDSPRVREALIPLFLRYPEFARYVPDLITALPPVASMTLRHLYTAAVYLQRLWRGKLEMYLGPLPLLPDYFGQSEWGLPAPTEHYGEAGLRALAEHFQTKTGDNWLSTYQAAISLFLIHLRLEADD